MKPDEPGFELVTEDAWPGTIRGAFDLLFELGMSRSTSWPASGRSSFWPSVDAGRIGTNPEDADDEERH